MSQFQNKAILENQQAVKELKSKIEWRQDFYALAAVSTDTKEAYESLMYWKSFKNDDLPKALITASVALPVLFFGLLTAYFITSKIILLSYLTYVFIANLVVLGRSLKRIQSEIAKADNIDKIIKQYSLLVQKIETENFQSKKLMDLQRDLFLKMQQQAVI